MKSCRKCVRLLPMGRFRMVPRKSRSGQEVRYACSYCRQCESDDRRKRAKGVADPRARRKRDAWFGRDGLHRTPGYYSAMLRLGRGYGLAIEGKQHTPNRRSRSAPFANDDEMVGEALKRMSGRVNLGVSWDGIVWSARYWLDDGFRAKEIGRTQAKEAKRWSAPDDGTLDSATVRRLFAEAGECHYCRLPMTPREKTMDHVVPLSKGGLHGVGNVAIACLRCNVSKGVRAAPGGKAPRPILGSS